MSSRADNKLKRNVEINAERWKRQDRERLKRELTKAEERTIEKAMEKSAEQIDRTGKHREVFK